MELTALEQTLLEVVREAHFEEVVDFGPEEDVCPGAAFCPAEARLMKHPPNIDVAVIELDEAGQMLDRANVLLSRDYPEGLVVPLDPDTGATGVRWLRWDIERWNGGTFSTTTTTGELLTVKGWLDNPPLTTADDIVLGREGAPYHFMLPYPASNFKLLIAYYLMRLVDRGEMSLDQSVTYLPPDTPPETRALSDWLDLMITVSDNYATKALLQELGRANLLDGLNREFSALGLSTLQLNGVDPATGYRWRPGSFHMTAFDTARLLWLIEGGEGVLWQSPNGPVTAAHLSPSSRVFLKELLAQQGLNEALSTSNLWGAAHVWPGIPSTVPARWVNPEDGTVTVAGISYGCDVRPGNAQAEVTFAHKTGLTYNYASDAGIVQSLPGQPYRHYVIAFFASLGYRYADPVFARATSLPAKSPVQPISYTQKIATLGQRLDSWFKNRGE